MARLRPTTTTGCRNGIATFGLLLVSGASLAAPAGSDVVTCAGLQQARVADGAPWRCRAALQANHSYLAEVARQTRDITLELIGPNGQRVLKVDSPTRRQGPELLFQIPHVAGNYTLVLDAADQSVPPAIVELRFREMPEAAPQSALARGMSAMTTAAATVEQPGKQTLQRQAALLRSAVAELHAAGAHAQEAEAQLRTAALNYWSILEWPPVIAAAREARRLYDTLPDPVMSAQAALLEAITLIEVRQAPQSGARVAPKAGRTPLDEAVDLLETAASQFHRAGLAYDEAVATNYLGIALYSKGRHAQARERYAAAARLFGQLREAPDEAMALQNIAVLDFDAGDYAEAVASYKRELPKLDPVRDRESYVTVLNNLGLAQSVLGNTDEAITTLLRALPLTQADTQVSERSRVYHNLGRTYLNLGDEERGRTFAEQALKLRQSAAGQDRRGLLTSLLRVGDLYREEGDTQRALKLHLQALDSASSPQENIRVLLAVGQDQMAAGTAAAAITTYERALKLDLPTDWPARTSVTGAYGYALSRSGRKEGRALLLKAAQTHAAVGDDELAAQDYYLLAAEEERAGEYESALRNVGKALSMFNSQRLRAVNPDLRATYVANRAAAYELQAGLYMSQWERAQGTADRNRFASAALSSVELLRQRALDDFRQFALQPGQGSASGAAALVELDSRLATKRHRLAFFLDQEKPDPERIANLRREIALLRTELDVAQVKESSRAGAAEPAAAKLSIADVQRSLAADAALVTWLPGEGRSWIWCITRTSANAYPLAAGLDLEAAARELHRIWSRPPTGAATSDREIKASEVILGPAGMQLAGQERIVVIADGALRAIPLGALWVTGAAGGKAHRLAESAVVSYQAALNRWTDLPGKAAKAEARPRILLVGDPVLIGETNGSTSVAQLRGTSGPDVTPALQRLPGSRREVEGIVGMADGWHADVLLGDAATKAAVLAQPLGTFRVLHFATHARLDVHDPQLSSVLLSSRQADVGRTTSALSLREIIGLGLHADAVVLSACEGSLGKEYRGQLSFGLSEAFLLAGANNVLGTLWQVSDAATARYMQSYYDNYLRRGLSASAAAQAAARVMMNDPVYGDPFYWAGFVVLAS